MSDRSLIVLPDESAQPFLAAINRGIRTNFHLITNGNAT